jgi:2,3-bisphosphoglycerate-independent phosphoglycerate mutase
MEAPDECGHHGDVENKIFSIEEIDEKVVKTVVENLKSSGEDFAVLIAPDHPTPIATRTHCSDPVPYLIYDSRKEKGVGAKSNDEEEAKNSGIFVEHGYELIQRLIGNK